jgi:hypothetical protein
VFAGVDGICGEAAALSGLANIDAPIAGGDVKRLAGPINKMADAINEAARLKRHLPALWQKKGAGKCGD